MKDLDRRGLSMHVNASETAGTRLAHWPPPHRGKENKPVLTRHEKGESAKRAKSRGWRLKRALFAEFGDEEG